MSTKIAIRCNQTDKYRIDRIDKYRIISLSHLIRIIFIKNLCHDIVDMLPEFVYLFSNSYQTRT